YRGNVVHNVMKRLQYIIILIICLSFFEEAFSQKYTKTNNDKEINTFLRKNFCGINKYHIFFKKGHLYFNKTNIIPEILDWEKHELFMIKNQDLCFVQTYNDTLITQSALYDFQKSYSSINYSTKKFDIFHGTKDKKHFTQISIPLFSSDNKLMIVKYKSWCGNECGSGGILVFKKFDEKWKQIDSRCTWMN
ncbi:hypothetical protein ACE01N_20600, partial [Saccharicrinis sp. FJH2]|uniref:hypothetical protein n=1 Tax=Saccharicrinis sp. FJH65 TaxID=3344659 RepID=UPI0035F3EB89